MSAQKIKLLALDVDGVMTDGSILYTADGEVMKAFHAQDGLGIKYLRKSGVEVAVISGRNSAPLARRLDDLGLRRRRLKCADKTAALQDICDDMGITLDDCAFMGDDWIDLDVMRRVAYAIAPSNAVAEVLAVARWVSVKAGGAGAVREACEHVASLNGINLVDMLDPKEYV